VSDYDEIRNLIASYSHTADDKRFEAYAENFAADGVLVEGGKEIPSSAMVKLQQIYSRAQDAMPQPRGTKHLQMNTVLHVEGDRARAVTDLLSIRLAPETGWVIGGTGRYEDEIVKQNGRWLFKRREVTWYKDLPSHLDDPAYADRLQTMIEEASR
jgi:hypothetical protein